jgi:hypothetical protein
MTSWAVTNMGVKKMGRELAHRAGLWRKIQLYGPKISQ